jgi:8-oxo-dGTP pyrophosphatase MutT (NUDIX family)
MNLLAGTVFLRMQIKLYFNNKTLFLTDTVTPDIDEYLHHEETIFIDEFSGQSVKAMIYEMGLPQIRTGVFLHDNLTELLKGFKKKLTLVRAAGGFVYAGDEVLLIFRRGKWDLPKGKLDEGETLESCAVREIKEETGIGALIKKPLQVTYHTYHENGRHILKESHWYLMEAGNKDTAPQTEEDIERCEWVPVPELPSYMANTHGSVADVVEEGIKFIAEGSSH